MRTIHFARIVNHRQFDRLVNLLDQGKILIGGNSDLDDRFIAPTLIDQTECDYDGPADGRMRFDLTKALAGINTTIPNNTDYYDPAKIFFYITEA